MTAGKRDAKNGLVKLTNMAGDMIERIDIEHDGTSTASWPNRLEVRFKAVAGVARNVFTLNEYGEPRIFPALPNTVASRWFAREYTTDPARDMTVPLIEVYNDRTNRQTQFAVYGDGDIYTAKDIDVAGNVTINGILSASNFGPGVRDLTDAYLSYWSAVVAGGTAGTNFNMTPTFSGTVTAAAYNLTTKYNSLRRVDYLVTTAAATAVAGFRTNLMMGRGAAGVVGGYKVRLRCGPATGVAVATHRFFLGLRNSAGAPTDVNPSTLVNMIGIGWDSGDARVMLMHNDASGTATKTDLGASFPKPTTDRSVIYELHLSCTNGGAYVDWTLNEIISGATASGQITSANQPAATTTLAVSCYASVGGTSSVVGVTVMDLYHETQQTW